MPASRLRTTMNAATAASQQPSPRSAASRPGFATLLSSTLGAQVSSKPTIKEQATAGKQTPPQPHAALLGKQEAIRHNLVAAQTHANVDQKASAAETKTDANTPKAEAGSSLNADDVPDDLQTKRDPSNDSAPSVASAAAQEAVASSAHVAASSSASSSSASSVSPDKKADASSTSPKGAQPTASADHTPPEGTSRQSKTPQATRPSLQTHNQDGASRAGALAAGKAASHHRTAPSQADAEQARTSSQASSDEKQNATGSQQKDAGKTPLQPETPSANEVKKASPASAKSPSDSRNSTQAPEASSEQADGNMQPPPHASSSDTDATTPPKQASAKKATSPSVNASLSSATASGKRDAAQGSSQDASTALSSASQHRRSPKATDEPSSDAASLHAQKARERAGSAKQPSSKQTTHQKTPFSPNSQTAPPSKNHHATSTTKPAEAHSASADSEASPQKHQAEAASAPAQTQQAKEAAKNVFGKASRHAKGPTPSAQASSAQVSADSSSMEFSSSQDFSSDDFSGQDRDANTAASAESAKQATSSSTGAASSLGASQSARRSLSPAWMRAAVNRTLRSGTLDDGWKMMEMKLDDGDGTMTVRARRDGDKMAVAVGFSDAAMHARADAQSPRLQKALQNQYGADIDFSLMSDGGSSSQQDSSRGSASRPTDRRADKPDRVEASANGPSARARSTGATREWVG